MRKAYLRKAYLRLTVCKMRYWTRHSPNFPLTPTFCDLGVWVWKSVGTGGGERKWQLKRRESTRRVKESSFIEQDGGGLLVLPTPGLGAWAKGPRVLFRPRPRERSSGPYPGCSPRTLRTCHCPGVWTGGWSASWWCCRSQKTPCGGGGGQRVSLRAPRAGLISQLCSSLPVSQPPSHSAGLLGPGLQFQALPLRQVPALACHPPRCPSRPWSSPRRGQVRP